MPKLRAPAQTDPKTGFVASKVPGQGGGIVRIGPSDDMVPCLLQTNSICVETDSRKEYARPPVIQSQSCWIDGTGPLRAVYNCQSGAAHCIRSRIAEENDICPGDGAQNQERSDERDCAQIGKGHFERSS